MNKQEIKKTIGYFPMELESVNLRTKQGQEHAREVIAVIYRQRATERRSAWQERVKTIDSDNKRENLHNGQRTYIYNSGLLCLCCGENSIKIENGHCGDYSREYGCPVYVVHNRVDIPDYYKKTGVSLSGKYSLLKSDMSFESDNMEIYTAGYSFIVCLNDREPDRNRNPWILENDSDFPKLNMFSKEYAFMWTHAVRRLKRISKNDISNYEVFPMGLDDYYLWEYEQDKFIVFGPGKMADDSNERLEEIFAK